jgi:hypothetical protein
MSLFKLLGNTRRANSVCTCHPPNPTAAIRTEVQRLHQESQRIFQRYHDVDRALFRLAVAATRSIYLDALCNPEFGYGTSTTLQLLTFLHDAYGEITSTNRENNLARMTAPWSPPEDLFKQLTDGQRMAASGGEPIPDSQVARMGYTIILSTGLCPEACHDWRLTPPAAQTFAAFITHFRRMNRDRLEAVTAASAGFHGAAYMVSAVPSLPPLHDAIRVPPVAFSLPTASPSLAVSTPTRRAGSSHLPVVAINTS